MWVEMDNPQNWNFWALSNLKVQMTVRERSCIKLEDLVDFSWTIIEIWRYLEHYMENTIKDGVYLTFISGAGKFAVCCWNWLNWSIQLIWDWFAEKLWLIIGELTASFDGSKGDGTAAGEVIWLVVGKSKTVDWLPSKFSFLMSIIGEIDPDDPPNS